MSYISGGIRSSQELFEAFDKMRELSVQSTPTTKLELAYDEDDIDDLYIELKERNDLISKLQTKIANLEKVTEDTRRVDDSIKREREQALKKNTNPWEHTSDLDSISAYLTGSTNKLDNELENNLKQATDLLSSFEDHLRRR